jgi:hypothetical protein
LRSFNTTIPHQTCPLRIGFVENDPSRRSRLIKNLWSLIRVGIIDARSSSIWAWVLWWVPRVRSLLSRMRLPPIVKLDELESLQWASSTASHHWWWFPVKSHTSSDHVHIKIICTTTIHDESFITLPLLHHVALNLLPT